MSISNRYDFVYLFDVQDGNPNGDPDAGNLPRIDPETGEGLVTDVCLKRKVRNYVSKSKSNQHPYKIYVTEKAVLNLLHEEAHKNVGSDVSSKKTEEQNSGKSKRKGGDKVGEARQWMCDNYYDVRTFGAVMSTGVNCGQVRGPVQLTFARSISPILSSEHSITRMAVTTEKEAESQDGDNRTMGRKFTVPYGLYRCHGFISPNFAKDTGFTDSDLKLFFEALATMFEDDRSASRGLMSARGLYVFQHESNLGNAPAHQLFERIQVIKKYPEKAARAFNDFEVRVDEANLPAGIILQKQIG